MTSPLSRFAGVCIIVASAARTLSAQTTALDPAASSAAHQATVPHALHEVSTKHRNEAEAAYLRGAKHMEEAEFSRAEMEFGRAVNFDPRKPEYLAALVLAREHRVTSLLQQAARKRPTDTAAADELISQARTLDSSNPRVQQHSALLNQPAEWATPVRHTQPASAITLKPNASKHTYHLRTDVRALATKMASDYGLRAAFEPDLRTAQVRIDVDDLGFLDSMRVLNLLSRTRYVPLENDTFILVADTPENRQRYERIVEETFYLPGLSADQLKDFVSIAQQVLDIRQVTVAPLGGALVLRGPADRVTAVEQIFNDLQQGTNEVLIDLKLYSVDKQHVRNLGIVLPQSLSAFSLAAQAQSIVSQNSALITQLVASGVLPSTASAVEIAAYLIFVAGVGGSSTLLTNSFLLFGGGATTGVLSAGNIPTLNLALTESEARTLDDVQLRVSDRQTGTFKSGTRYPIQTSLFSDIATSTATSLASTTVNGVSLSSLLASYLGTSSLGSTSVIPQVQYEDLGLTVTAVPHIQRTSEVSMKLEVKVTSLAGAALNGIPVLDSRQFSSDLTVLDGETVMMISNTTQSESAAVNGLPGLSELPGFQSTTNRNGTKMTSDLVLMITPHIVRHGHLNAKGPYIPLVPRPGEE